MHCAFDISVIVFVTDSIPTETEKTGALFTSGKKAAAKNEYYPLTNRARGSYWGIKVVPVRTERRKRTDRSKVRTKIDRRPIFPVRLDQARLESTLLYGTRAKLVLILPALKNKEYTAYDRFHGNGPYGEISPKKEPIKSIGFPSRLPCHNINSLMYVPSVICNS